MIRWQSRSGSSRLSSACTGDLRIVASVSHNQRVERETAVRDVGVVLSGGAINGVLMECGFLMRLRETALWPRIACIFGTSAGALSGAMAALDRLDDLEAFLLALQPHETFRPNPLWRQPFLGLHSYALPRTVGERLGDPLDFAHALRKAQSELVVFVTDVSWVRNFPLGHAYDHPEVETIVSFRYEPRLRGVGGLDYDAIRRKLN